MNWEVDWSSKEDLTSVFPDAQSEDGLTPGVDFKTGVTVLRKKSESGDELKYAPSENVMEDNDDGEENEEEKEEEVEKEEDSNSDK